MSIGNNILHVNNVMLIGFFDDDEGMFGGFRRRNSG